MQYRRFGRTGWKVSEIGYGMWGMGGQWAGADDNESFRCLQRAVELGCNLFDTAWAYGEGRSEKLLRRLLREHPRRPLYVATKIPPKNLKWPGSPKDRVKDVYPPEHIREYAEKSLTNLGRDAIDLLQFHVWDDAWAKDEAWQRAVDDLKKQGLIRAFGISVNRWEPDNVLSALGTGLVDAVQVIYNIFDQSPEDRLFPACRERNVGVLARVPFDEGGLTGKITPETRFPEDDFRNRYFRGDRRREVSERCRKIAADLGIGLDLLPETALRFCLSHPAVSTVIPGMRSVRHVESNVAAGDGRGLAGDRIAKLRPHRWVRDFYA